MEEGIRREVSMHVGGERSGGIDRGTDHGLVAHAAAVAVAAAGGAGDDRNACLGAVEKKTRTMFGIEGCCLLYHDDPLPDQGGSSNADRQMTTRAVRAVPQNRESADHGADAAVAARDNVRHGEGEDESWMCGRIDSSFNCGCPVSRLGWDADRI